MAIPSDFAGLVAWHEADSQTEASYAECSQLLGLGGMPDGQVQATASKRPTIVPYTGSHKAYRLDATDDFLLLASSTALNSRPLTVFVVYASRTEMASGFRRVLAGDDTSTHNWLIGPYSNKYQAYVGGFIDGGAHTELAIKVHTVRQQTAGTLAEYWIDGVSKGTSSSTNVPGVISVGPHPSSYTEPAYSDVFAVVTYNVALLDADRAAIETYLGKWAGSTYIAKGQFFSQLAIEAVGDGTPNARLSQHVIEAVQGANPNLRMSQQVIEVVNGASPNVRMSQLIIEVVHARRRGYNWAQLVG